MPSTRRLRGQETTRPGQCILKPRTLHVHPPLGASPLLRRTGGVTATARAACARLSMAGTAHRPLSTIPPPSYCHKPGPCCECRRAPQPPPAWAQPPPFSIPRPPQGPWHHQGGHSAAMSVRAGLGPSAHGLTQPAASWALEALHPHCHGWLLGGVPARRARIPSRARSRMGSSCPRSTPLPALQHALCIRCPPHCPCLAFLDPTSFRGEQGVLSRPQGEATEAHIP